MKIRSEKAMQEAGWVKDEHGTWVAPHEKGIQVARYDANGKKERVLLVEARQEVGSDDRRTDDSPTGSTRKEVENSQLHAYQRLGMDRATAIRAVELGNGKARYNKG
jgi:hypothetical protein